MPLRPITNNLPNKILWSREPNVYEISIYKLITGILASSDFKIKSNVCRIINLIL